MGSASSGAESSSAAPRRRRRPSRCAGGEQSARVNGHFPSGLSRRKRGAGGARARSARRRARGRAREHERAAARAIAARERLARAAGAPKVIRARADAPPEALRRGGELLSIRDDGRGARGAAARTRAHPAMIRRVGRTSNRASRPETRRKKYESKVGPRLAEPLTGSTSEVPDRGAPGKSPRGGRIRPRLRKSYT